MSTNSLGMHCKHYGMLSGDILSLSTCKYEVIVITLEAFQMQGEADLYFND